MMGIFEPCPPALHSAWQYRDHRVLPLSREPASTISSERAMISACCVEYVEEKQDGADDQQLAGLLHQSLFDGRGPGLVDDEEVLEVMMPEWTCQTSRSGRAQTHVCIPSAALNTTFAHVYVTVA